MSIYERVLNDLKYNRNLRLEGKYPCIPWLSLPKLSSVIPGIQKGRYIIVTANSKVGKTQICDFLFLYEPIEFILKNPDCNIKLKIFYFSLEISKEDKILQMLCYKLYKDYKLIYTSDQLKSYFKGYILEENLLKIFESEEYKNFFAKVEEIVVFVDKIRNPFGIYKFVRDFAYQNGKFYNKDNQEVSQGEMYEYYVPNDPDLYVEVITDNVSLLTPEKGEDLWTAIFKFSSDYCLKMRDNFKYTVINIQQQSADQEKQQFTFKGDSIINKIRPSPDGLGDCKLTGRDCDLMIGLFAPNRYKIEEYEGYNITKLRDNYRELSILLNRRGGGAINLDLYFNGAVNYFAELPKPESITDEQYNKLLSLK